MNLFLIRRYIGIAGVAAGVLLGGCGGDETPSSAVAGGQSTGSASTARRQAVDPAPTYSDWPAVTSAIAKDPAMETRIAQIVAGMTLEQKVGQMTQPEIGGVTPDEVRQYFIGSVLNGGGSWPTPSNPANKYPTAADWVKLADAYYTASMTTSMSTQIPIIWGTDAIHGASNVWQATLFPHNIGLGAARDPALVQRIGAAVGQATRATGINWVFAPTLAVARDDRWGRTYESFSEDPAVVRAYGGAYVTGLQGTFATDNNVVATAKHFIGDGGTDKGVNEGVNMSSRLDMINIHGQGYYTALAAGAQTVMASFNSWNNPAQGISIGKMHGSQEMLTNVLKTKMGFDGFVISDWNGIGQVPGCTNISCPAAINAGVDMVMVPNYDKTTGAKDWKFFIANTVNQVNSGQIPMARINDAVTRILRVKMRSGLFKPGYLPSKAIGAGDQSRLASRALAREAVQKSLVLLKNNNGVLPITRGRRILVVGSSADNMPNQVGGWSLTWQGDNITNGDFAGIGDTILAGIKEATGASNVTYSETGENVDVNQFDMVVAVMGETPYAEINGDIGDAALLGKWNKRGADLAALQRVSGKGKPVVTVLVAGRPLYVNDLVNLSDAFVMAWLPGTEGKGVSDVLFRNASGAVNLDFVGTLPFSWPANACQTPLNTGDGQIPQFAFNYGLKYSTSTQIGTLATPSIPAGCVDSGVTRVFNTADVAPYALFANSESNGWQPVQVGAASTLNVPSTNPGITITTTQINTQDDAKLVTWFTQSQFYTGTQTPQNLSTVTNGTIEFDTIVMQTPSSAVKMHMDCVYPCRGSIDATNIFRNLPVNTKQTVKIPLSCFAAAGTTMTSVTTPFNVQAGAGFKAAFTNIKIVRDGASASGVSSCNGGVTSPTSFSLFSSSGFAPGFTPNAWSSMGNHVTFTSVPTSASVQAEVQVQYSWNTGANGIFYISGGQMDLSGFSAGQLLMDVYMYSYGTNTRGLSMKLESSSSCGTVDVPMGRPAGGQWVTVSVPMSTVFANAASCFDRAHVNFLSVFPAWGDQTGVQMTVRNIRFSR